MFGYVSLQGLYSLMGRLKDMVIDVAVLLEGHDDDELPDTLKSFLKSYRGHVVVSLCLAHLLTLEVL